VELQLITKAMLIRIYWTIHNYPAIASDHSEVGNYKRDPIDCVTDGCISFVLTERKTGLAKVAYVLDQEIEVKYEFATSDCSCEQRDEGNWNRRDIVDRVIGHCHERIDGTCLAGLDLHTAE
jgi:hypothetical protein